VQERRVLCRDTVSLKKTADSDCAHLIKPATTQACNTQACPFWETADWGPVRPCKSCNSPSMILLLYALTFSVL
jgi:hypothetical protein